MKTIRVLTEHEAQRVAGMITGLPLPFTITIGDGDKRSLSQNALVHKWYGQIAQHLGDMTAAQVKGQCHVAYGVPIRRRDPIWSRVWERMFDGLTYEQQCFLFERGILAMTREMTVKELTEYMDAVQGHYRAQGVPLIDPEAMKYENEVTEMKSIYDVIGETSCHVCADGGEVEYHGDEDGQVWCIVCETAGPSAHCQTKIEAAHEAYAAYMKMRGEVPK